MEHIDNPTLGQLAKIAADQNKGCVTVKAMRVDDFFKRFGEVVMESPEEVSQFDPGGVDLTRIITACRWYARQKCGGKEL